MEDALQRAQAYLDAEAYQQALAAYEEIVQEQPGNARALVGKGNALDELYQPEASLAAYEQAIHLEPQNIDAWLGMSHLFLVFGEHVASSENTASELALAASERALAIDSTNPDAHVARGDALDAAYRQEEAQAAYDRAVELAPEHVDAWLSKAHALWLHGEIDEEDEETYLQALACSKRATELDPTNAEAYLIRGNALWYLERDEEAVEACRRATELDPDYTEAYKAWATKLGHLDRDEEADEALQGALAAYERVNQREPTNWIAYLNKGSLLHWDLHRDEEALVAYEAALRIRPDDADGWSSKASVLKEMQRYEEALAAYDEALRLRPSDAHAQRFRGHVLKETQRYEEALAAYDASRELASEHSLHLWERGDVLSHLQRYEEALAVFERPSKKVLSGGPMTPRGCR